MRTIYGKEVIDALRASGLTGNAAVALAIDFLRANLTDAAIHGCHHCGESDADESPCRWCGLRDTPRRIRR